MIETKVSHLDNRYDLPFLLKEMGLNNRGVEIGVGTGDYSYSLIKDGQFSEFYSIDTWDDITPDSFNADGSNVFHVWGDECYKISQEKLAEFGEKSKILRSTSADASTKFDNDYFDFIYIDADHTLEAVRNDIQNWYPKLRSGGMLAGHDYLDDKLVWENGSYSMFGVISAVTEFSEKKQLQVYIIKEKNNQFHSWYLIKP